MVKEVSDLKSDLEVYCRRDAEATLMFYKSRQCKPWYIRLFERLFLMKKKFNLVDHKSEKFMKFSKRDMQRIWRTLKAEMGPHEVVRPYPGVKQRQLTYWMNAMENRLQEEISSRPSFILRLFKRKVSKCQE